MSVLPIYNCFHPVLKKKTQEITEINDQIVRLIDNMYDTLYNTANGVGLAANQVGVDKSIIIIDIGKGTEEQPENDPITLINPVITAFSEEESEYNEGCLSIPDIYEKIWRPEHIEIKYYDLNMKEFKIEADKFLSRVIQHEVDHLNGILFFERLTSLRRTLLSSKLKRIKKGDYEAEYDMILADGKKLRGVPSEE